MYMYLLDHAGLGDHDLSSLTRCTVGGQTMPVAKMQAVEEALGCPLIELWGMTELGGLGTTHTLYGPRKLGSIGIALPHLGARRAGRRQAERCRPARSAVANPRSGDVREYLGHPDATAGHRSPAAGCAPATGAHRRRGFIFVDRLKDDHWRVQHLPGRAGTCDRRASRRGDGGGGRHRRCRKGELAKAYIVLRGRARRSRDRAPLPRAPRRLQGAASSSSSQIFRKRWARSCVGSRHA